MIADTDIFHQAMLPSGGRFDVTSAAAPAYWLALKSVATQMIEGMNQFMPRMPKVHFDFVSNPELQAYAFTDQGRYFIGFFSGTVYLLDLVFCRMMCDRRVLPRIGNVVLERKEPQSLAGMTLDAERACNAGLSLLLPNCPARLEYKCRLLEWAFRFLVSHEIGHIAGGHVDYMDKEYGLPFLAELGWTGQSESETMLRQSLELEADAQGAGSLATNMPQRATNHAHPLSLEDCVFGSVFAFCSLFRLLGDATFSGREATQAYPPVRVRQMLCAEQGIQMIKKWPADVRETCLDKVVEAVNAAEQILPLLTGEPVSIAGLTEAFGKTGKDYAEKLRQHHLSVTEPALRPYKYHDF